MLLFLPCSTFLLRVSFGLWRVALEVEALMKKVPWVKKVDVVGSLDPVLGR